MPQNTVYGKVWIGRFFLCLFSFLFSFFLRRASSACLKEIKFHMKSCFLAFVFKVYGIMQRQCCLLSYMPWENMMFHYQLAVGYMAIYHTKRNQKFIKIFLIAFEDVAFSLSN